MLELVIQKLQDTTFLTALFTAIAVAATAWTLITTLVPADGLEKRMKAVAVERAAIRQRERERLAHSERIDLRGRSPKDYMRVTVEQLNLRKWLGEDDVREKLRRAGFRGHGPYVVFLFFRLVAPVGLFLFTALYIFAIVPLDLPATVKIMICVVAAYLGIKAPDIFLKNRIQQRHASIKRAFPDALDLLLICVEAGMSIEVAFRKVSEEIGTQSVPLAEEFTLTTAELSYLPDRRAAYENLANRVDIDGVKAVCMALIQSERYGTPLGQTLRVMAQENRDIRMTEAEKKAAALPPKLTVPMILFFLPVLFVVILGPAAIQIIKMRG
ncbi:type II secretion system F family protein [Blastochloris viridis]|uniref:Flp pilus assembly protein TadB n=1 Tax=Blastochloris viridis TaxID=1079 RepID=A0A0H5BPL8_BLAVI|nr:type II secretion system F family protein [Blastochloris viridis]ALK10534.1 Bacterial type II secretion system protein F domain protein [Blastochloris viridis]BAR99513.1 type II/IV secretion system protein TadC [Blastochloris viridis]CUU43196.1 Flp pilus assembly protein TadB [Blastochloris viridis]